MNIQSNKLTNACKWLATGAMTIALVASNFAPAQATPDAQSEKVVTSSDSETAEETWKTQEASRKAKPANDLGGKISFSANDTSITAPAKIAESSSSTPSMPHL